MTYPEYPHPVGHSDPDGPTQAYGYSPPPPMGPPAQPYGQWPQMPPPGYGYPAPRPPKKNTGVLIAVIIGAVVLVGLGLLAAPFIYFATLTNDLDDSIADSSGARTEQILEDELEVTLGAFVADNGPDDGHVTVTLRNKGDESSSYGVQIEAVDANGDRIDDAYVSADSLAPGQSVAEETTFWEEGVDFTEATFKIIKVTKH